jgi:hypothetical protein
LKGNESSIERERIEHQTRQIEFERIKNQYELSEKHLQAQIQENEKQVQEVQSTRKSYLKKLEEAEDKCYSFRIERNEFENKFQKSEQEKQRLDGMFKKTRTDYERLLKEKLEGEYNFGKEREAMQALVENYKSCEAEAQREKNRALQLAQETEAVSGVFFVEKE